MIIFVIIIILDQETSIIDYTKCGTTLSIKKETIEIIHRRVNEARNKKKLRSYKKTLLDDLKKINYWNHVKDRETKFLIPHYNMRVMMSNVKDAEPFKLTFAEYSEPFLKKFCGSPCSPL